MRYIVATLFFLSQTIVFPNLSFRWAKEVTLQFLALYTLCCLIWDKNKWIALYVGYSIIMFFVQKNFIINDCANGIAYNINPMALMNLMNIVLIGVLFIVLHHIKLDKNIIIKTICLVAVFQSCYVILQKCGIDEFFVHLKDGHTIETWPVGTWANEALVSWSIAMCSPFLLAYRELRFKIGYAVCFVALLCAKVTTPITGFIIGFLFWLWHKNKKLTVALILWITLIGVALYTTGHLNYYLQDTHRIRVWTKAFELTKRPLTGMGVGSFRQLFPIQALEFAKDGAWVQTHNEYLQVFFEQGVLGLIPLIGLIFTVGLSYYRKRRGLIPLISLIITAYISFFSFPFHTAMGGIAIIALVLYEKELIDDADTDS